MGHCNPQMSDFAAQTPPGLNSGVYVKSKDTVNSGASAGDGCSSNGSRVACSYRQSWNAVVVYDGDGNTLWGSSGLLDNHTFFTVPIMQSDGSMLIGDDQHLYKINSDFSIAWSTPTPGGSPIGLLPTPNAAIVSATGSQQLVYCFQENCTLTLTIANGGTRYTEAAVVLAGGDCPGATATAAVSGGAVTGVTVTSQGYDCAVAPDVVILGDGQGAFVTASLTGPGPINVYNANTGAVLASTYLYQNGNSGPYYLTNNTPCLNNASYANRIYVITNLSTDSSQGALFALDVDPTNRISPISVAWNLTLRGPSAASPLCAGNDIYFDGAGIQPGDNVGTTIFGVQDNGTSGSFLFEQVLGPGTGQLTCNFALDPRPEGGFWHQIQYDPTLYHRDFITGDLIETVNVSNLLTTMGAPPSTYWQAGAFTTYGTPDHPYIMLPEAAYPAKTGSPGYMAMMDLTTLQLVWALPLAGNDQAGFESPGGDAALVLDSNQNPVIVMSGKQAGAFFVTNGGPDSTVSPGQLSFGPQAVGTTSSSQTVNLFNSASSALKFGSATVGGPFSVSNTCGATLAPGVSCAISVNFVPTQKGIQSGALTITSNSQASPQVVPIIGAGTLATPAATLSSSQLLFPTQNAGTTSTPQAVSLLNTGLAALAISQISGGGAAVEVNNCPTLLAVGASCTIQVMLATPLTGACSGTITLATNSPGSPQTIAATGSCQAVPAIESSLSTSSLVFEPHTAGTVSAAQVVTFSNIGSLALQIASINASGSATETNNCGTALAVKGSCTINVQFAPSATGMQSGAITVTDAAPDSPHVVAISGIGMPNPVPIVNQPLLPAAALPGTAGMTLLVNGSGFVPGSVVYWNGTPRVTTAVSGTQLSGALTAADLASPNTGAVSVVNPAPGGGQSNAVWLPVGYYSPAPSPAISTITAGGAPSAIVTADFNNDGKLDLAVTNSGGNNVSIFSGNGDGTFGSAVNLATGNLPIAIAAADLNHDGVLDLVIANQSDDTVSVLLGAGGGKFAPQVVYSTGDQPAAIAIADVNGDGNLDLAVANRGDNTVSILLGNGDGTFAPQLAYAAGESPDAVIAGDFNGDGKADLAVGNDVTPGGSVTILLNHGDGSYLPGVSYATGDTVSLVAADLNGDGVLDFAAVNYLAQTLSVYLGNGSGVFTVGPYQTTRLAPTLSGLAAADMNADGSLELVISANGADGFTTVQNNDAGTFSVILQTGAVAQATAVAVGDFNNDGSMDAALVSSALNSISIVMQAPEMSFSAATLSFGSVALGGSATQTVTVTNSGSAVLQISKMSAGGVFSETNNCTAAIAPGNTCSVTLVFSPATTGTLSGTLTIQSNAPGAPRTVSLGGTGVTFAASISLSSSAVIGGNPAASNVTVLSSAAPAGGWTVSLTSSNPAVAAVPATVPVAAGQTVSSAFTITTTAVSNNTPVTITATVNGFTASSILNVNPIAVTVSLSAATMTGGTVLGSNTIVLANPAPTGGLIFNLTSTNPTDASVPASVTVPPGATVSGTFTITAAQVSSQTSPTIYATLSGVGSAIAYATITVRPPSLSSVVLSAGSLVGGQSTTGNTVNLASPAPGGGVTVNLTSSKNNLVTVPASVIVPANAISAPFSITTGNVSAQSSVTITASVGVSGTSVTGTLTLTPNGVSTFNLAAASVVGGGTLGSNTVTLLAPAPSNGATVDLVSDDPATATMPVSVKVPAGLLTSNAFKITTSVVTAPTPVILNATYRGTTAPATIIMEPLEPASLTLGAQTVVGGKTIAGNTVNLNGAAPMGGAVMSLSSSDPAVASVPSTVTVAGGKSTSPKFNIVTSAVTKQATITITASYQGYTTSAKLTVKP